MRYSISFDLNQRLQTCKNNLHFLLVHNLSVKLRDIENT